MGKPGCGHSFDEMDAHGSCPICQAAEIERLREVLGVLARLEERAFRTRDELAAGVRRVAGDALEPV